ncbi:F0F1 ATP synthase subunit delta [Macrococcus equipercicus]|uniref:ATP synthase subunit delta n=1 Tax=Macrococcus equipercicus TaxID=69967 RepID=A0A9Q9F1N7_9STAP|nr:F0F1 ATP synthase subunit delta [Macrococcus equipercicus]UTH13541.1 F0F1 ATP synthase subunit delta [Macrococcus equipercicus]
MAQVAKKYAESLFEVSRDSGVQESVHADLKEINLAVSSQPAFQLFAEDPKVSKEARIRFVKETFGGADQPLLNLLQILAERKQLSLLPAIADSFESYYNEYNEQQYMKVESVYALTREELDAIGQSFIQRTGYKKLLLDNVINPQLIGGIRATIGTTVYDGSIQNNLKQLEKSFHQQ